MLFTSLFLMALATFSVALDASTTLSHRHRHLKKRATDAQISAFLDGHNEVRAQHGAIPLQWSSDLASKAEQWANECQFKHSDGTLSGDPYGENIVAGTGTFPVSTAVEWFTKSQSDYTPANPEFSQWTQVVWKDTKDLGCAVVRCPGLFGTRNGVASLTVCLYSPPGNVVGKIQDNVQA